MFGQNTQNQLLVADGPSSDAFKEPPVVLCAEFFPHEKQNTKKIQIFFPNGRFFLTKLVRLISGFVIPPKAAVHRCIPR